MINLNSLRMLLYVNGETKRNAIYEYIRICIILRMLSLVYSSAPIKFTSFFVSTGTKLHLNGRHIKHIHIGKSKSHQYYFFKCMAHIHIRYGLTGMSRRGGWLATGKVSNI